MTRGRRGRADVPSVCRTTSTPLRTARERSTRAVARPAPPTMTSESGETRSVPPRSVVATYEPSILLWLDRRGRDLRDGDVQLRSGLLRPDRLPREPAAAARMVGLHGVGAGHGVLRRGCAAAGGDR